MLLQYFSQLEDMNNPLLGPTLWGLNSSFLLASENKRIINIGIHILATIFVCTQHIELWFIRSDLHAALRNLSISMLSSSCMIKAWTFIAWDNEWKNIFENVSNLEREQILRTHNETKKIIAKYTLHSRRITLFYWGLVAVTVCAVILAPSVTYLSSKTQRELIKNGTLPYPEIMSSWFPFDRSRGLGYCCSVVVHSLITVYGGGIVANYDANAVVLMIFFKSQLELLSFKCSQIFHDERGAFSEAQTVQNIQDCHKLHQFLIKYCKMLNSLMSPVMFLYIVICSLMICASAVQLNTKETSNFQRFWISEYLIALISQLFLYCWYSNEVLYVSQHVDEGVYSSSWWWWRGVPARRSVLLLQGQLRKEIVFMAGPFTKLTVSTFLAIMKGSYSYYTLLSKKEN